MLETKDIIDSVLKNKNSNSLIPFLNSLFEVEVVAHIAHLQTKSYAQHMALNSLYSDIVDLRDRFIESYQGKYGIVKGYGDIKINEGKDMCLYLSEKITLSEQTRSKLTDGYLQQIIDDIIELYASTLYKLKNLS